MIEKRRKEIIDIPNLGQKTFEQAVEGDRQQVLVGLYMEVRRSGFVPDKFFKGGEQELLDSIKQGIVDWLQDTSEYARIHKHVDRLQLLEDKDKSEDAVAARQDFQGFVSAVSMLCSCGERTQWARNLGLEGLLVEKILRYEDTDGNILDQHKGFRTLSETELLRACHDFFVDLTALLKIKQDEMKQLKGSKEVSSSGATDVENFKFHSAAKAVYAHIDDFYLGPEARIGFPNPQLLDGMRAEHCTRQTASLPFVAPNYGLCTTSQIEWYWVEDPQIALSSFNKVSQAFLSDDNNNAEKKFLFPGEIGQHIKETVLAVEIPKGREENVKPWETEVLERLRLVFAPGSKSLKQLLDIPDEQNRNRLREIKLVKNAYFEGEKLKMRVSVSFSQDCSSLVDPGKLNYYFCKAQVRLLLSKAIISNHQEPEAGQELILLLQFEGMRTTWTDMIEEKYFGPAPASTFVCETVQNRIHSLCEKPELYLEPEKSDPAQKHQQEKSNVNKKNQTKVPRLLTTRVINPPYTSEINSDVEMLLSLKFERPMSYETEAAPAKFEVKRLQDLWNKESIASVDLSETKFSTVENIVFEYVTKPNKVIINAKSRTLEIPELTVRSLESTLADLSERLNEQSNSLASFLDELKKIRASKREYQGRRRAKPLDLTRIELDSREDTNDVLTPNERKIAKYFESLLDANDVLTPNERKIAKDEARKSAHKLDLAEVIALILYTGPMYVIYNALLRFFPSNIVAQFGSNRFESTIFAIISGISNLSRITNVPKSRTLYRGLSGVVPPEEFWKSNKGDSFLGVVEFGLQSTTERKEVAVQYSGEKKEIIIFEMQVGKIDTGASISFLSQYPGEKEFLMPPLTCLEVGALFLRLS